MALELDVNDILPVNDYYIQKKSKCFIIVNEFKDNNELKLPGYKRDVENLTDTLEHLNFDITIERDLAGGKIVKQTNRFLALNDFSEDECVAFAIFSHGHEHGKIVGADNNTANTEDIIQLFTDNEELAGKPKLFFIQACRGKFKACATSSEIRTAAMEQRCQEAGVFVFYSTFPRYVSLVDDTHGSFFIQALCKVLQAYGGRHSLQKIATKVNDIVSSHVVKQGRKTLCQTSEIRHTLMYDVYLSSDGTYPTNEAQVGQTKTRSPGGGITRASLKAPGPRQMQRANVPVGEETHSGDDAP